MSTPPAGPRLLIDVGNSRLKWALHEQGALGVGSAHAHAGEPAALVAQITPETAPVAVWIASVAGAELDAALQAALLQRFGIAPRFARSEAQRQGLRSAYAEPQRLGIDRWLGMLAARAAHPGSAVNVISAGTALTFDAVDASGQHLGGVIAPGLLTAQRSTLGATRFAAAAPREEYAAGLGQNTEACVRQGALHAVAGLVERLARRHPGRCWISGGDAELLRAHLQIDTDWHPQLVLEGLLQYGAA